nr:MAG TPA: hypothetical protein [Caudoviricetes sp.]
MSIFIQNKNKILFYLNRFSSIRFLYRIVFIFNLHNYKLSTKS